MYRPTDRSAKAENKEWTGSFATVMNGGMLDPQLLALLRCPETRQPLAELSPKELARLESARAAGTLQTRAGRTVNERVEAGLVREDGAYVYPIREGIPVLLVDEALPLGAA